MERRVPLWLKFTALTALITVTGMLVALALRSQPAPNQAGNSDRSVEGQQSGSGGPASAVASSFRSEGQLDQLISQAVGSKRWPQQQPTDRLGDSGAPESSPCAKVEAGNLADCSFGPRQSGKLAVLLGDSVATSWLPGIRAALEPLGWRIQGLTYAECPAPVMWVTGGRATAASEQYAFTTPCVEHASWALARAAQVKPDLVIFASAENSLDRVATGVKDKVAADEWQSATIDAVNRLGHSVKRVVVLAPPPETKNVRSCDARESPPGDCDFSIDATWNRMSDADRAAATTANATYVDTRRWFCDAQGRCPPFVGRTIVRTDGLHLTSGFSKQLAPLLADALLSTTTTK